MTAATSAATRLSVERIASLREQARRTSGGHIDPRALHRVDRASFFREWATAILGRDYPGVRWLDSWEISLIDLALTAEPDRPVPAAEFERREQARRSIEAGQRAVAAAYLARLDTWHALKARLPVLVTVGHNQTIGHWESGHVAARDHIVVQDDLQVGRLHRTARRALCETPAKNRSGGRRNPDPLRGLVRDDDGEDRIPTCKACMHVAERIARPGTLNP